jgi:peptidoglycan/LPS O-acetylase OafA/YrhL
VFVGTISFSLYLWQQPFANPGLPVAHAFPLGIVWSLLAATASYFLVEKPFLRLKDRYTAREARRVRDDALRMPAPTDAIVPKVVE